MTPRSVSHYMRLSDNLSSPPTSEQTKRQMQAMTMATETGHIVPVDDYREPVNNKAERQ